MRRGNLLGVAFGLLDAIIRGFDLLAPWLLIAYALFLTMFVVGGRVQGPWIDRVAAAAEAGDQASPELQRVVHARGPTVAMYVSWLLLAGIVFSMLVKPLS